ncbi:MAG TPA: FliH/SctL family protein [Nitrospirota bacterium]|nr:FliH/SctL family protein [Nitrospirota bacterium]
MGWLAEVIAVRGDRVSKRILKSEVRDNSDIKTFHLKKVENVMGEMSSASSGEIDSEIKHIKLEAYNKGLEDGMNRGRIQVLQDVGAELKILKGLIEGADKLKDELYGKIENDVVEISLMIARKIIGEIAEKARDVVVNSAKEAIKRASDREVLKIRVAPADYDALNKKRSELLQCIDGIKSLLIEVDESVQPGGCLIETNQGDIDARIESQFKVLQGALTAAR